MMHTLRNEDQEPLFWGATPPPSSLGLGDMVGACITDVDRKELEKIDGVVQGEWLEWSMAPMEGQHAGVRHQPQARHKGEKAKGHVSTMIDT